jgi:hypothetical protein
MLKLKNQIPGKSLLVLAAVAVGFTSCKDDDVTPSKRNKTYNLTSSTGTGASRLSLQELTDSTFTLTMRIEKSTKDSTYHFVLFNGNTNATALDTFQLIKSVKSQTTGAPIEVKWENVKNISVGNNTVKFNYDSIIKKNLFARVAFVDKPGTAAAKDSVIAIGNIANSAQ